MADLEDGCIRARSVFIQRSSVQIMNRLLGVGSLRLPFSSCSCATNIGRVCRRVCDSRILVSGLRCCDEVSYLRPQEEGELHDLAMHLAVRTRFRARANHEFRAVPRVFRACLAMAIFGGRLVPSINHPLAKSRGLNNRQNLSAMMWRESLRAM